MIHFALRKVLRNGRSKVIGFPGYVVQAMGINPGDRFSVLYDDERQTVTLQRYTSTTVGPEVIVDGRRVDTLLMP